MNYKYLFIYLLICQGCLSCSIREKNYIVTKDGEQLTETGKYLACYLSKIYLSILFKVVAVEFTGRKSILPETASDSEWNNNEAFKISEDDNQLFIKRKLLYAIDNSVNDLLKYLTWNFYLTFKVSSFEP